MLLEQNRVRNRRPRIIPFSPGFGYLIYPAVLNINLYYYKSVSKITIIRAQKKLVFFSKFL